MDFECEPASIDLDELPSLAWFGETGSVMRSHLRLQLFPAVERLADSWANAREYGDTHVESDAQLSELRCAIAADVRDQLKAAQWRDAGLARSTTRSAPVQRHLRVTVPPEALERGGETHLRWAEAEWGPLEHDTRRLVELLCRCLDRGDVAQARELANRLRDAQPRSPLAT